MDVALTTLQHFRLPTFVCGFAFLSIACWLAWLRRTATSGKGSQNVTTFTTSDIYDTIKARLDFDWRNTIPIRLRPFRPQYHLTMSISSSTISELIEVDDTYLSRIKQRRELVESNTHSVMACNAVAGPAVLELYHWVMRTYLPQRYPNMFNIARLSSDDETLVLHNIVTDENISLIETDSITALRTLNAHVDTDFIFLLPSSQDKNGQPIYHEEAFIACFPNGFSFRDKLSLPLATIHKPVPGYASKLERSMDRYFARLTVGTVVKRANWSVTTHDRLFAETGNHFYKEQSNEASADHAAYQRKVEVMRQEINLDACRLRCERQTLHRLPVSGAIVFGIKTYQYTLQSVKDAGDGHVLAEAIDGLGKGNVPDMLYYKRGIIWGDKVADFLRSS